MKTLRKREGDATKNRQGEIRASFFWILGWKEGGFDARSRLLKDMARDPRLMDNPTGLVEITSRTLLGLFLLLPSDEVNDLIARLSSDKETLQPLKVV